MSHVSAHQDQPWNELVDSFAKAAAFAEFTPACLDRNLVNAGCDSPYIAWMPVTQSSINLDAYPPCIDMDVHATSNSTHTGDLDMYHKETPCNELLEFASGSIRAHGDSIVLRIATHSVMSAVDIPG